MCRAGVCVCTAHLCCISLLLVLTLGTGRNIASKFPSAFQSLSSIYRLTLVGWHTEDKLTSFSLTSQGATVNQQRWFKAVLCFCDQLSNICGYSLAGSNVSISIVSFSRPNVSLYSWSLSPADYVGSGFQSLTSRGNLSKHSSVWSICTITTNRGVLKWSPHWWNSLGFHYSLPVEVFVQVKILHDYCNRTHRTQITLQWHILAKDNMWKHLKCWTRQRSLQMGWLYKSCQSSLSSSLSYATDNCL